MISSLAKLYCSQSVPKTGYKKADWISVQHSQQSIPRNKVYTEIGDNIHEQNTLPKRQVVNFHCVAETFPAETKQRKK